MKINLVFRKYIYEIVLFAIWILIIIAVNPHGDFPINDDWAYSKIVKHLTQEGRFIMGDWPAMTLATQVLWGTGFCKILGFSFNVLRLSTIVSSCLSTIILYTLINNITNNKQLSFFTTLAWLFNPIYFSLSFTFMTDIHFLFFSLLSLFFYFKHLKHDKILFLISGSFFALATTLTRQQGIILPFAFAIVMIIKSKKTIKNFIISLLPPLVIWLAFSNYISWLIQNHNLPWSYGKMEDIKKFFNENDFSFFYLHLGLVWLYIGLLFIPLTFYFLPYLKKTDFNRKMIFAIILCGILIPAMNSAWDFFPSGNTLYNGGLGPKLLKDTCRGDNILPVLSKNNLNGIRIICLISVIIFIVLLTRKITGIKNYFVNISDSPERLIKVCAAILFITYFAFLIINPIYFDRYCLPLILFLLIIAVPLNESFELKKSMAGIIILAAFGLFSISYTHDYFSWNRTRWQALNYLMKEKQIKPTQIDGGFEFNAWYLSETGIYPDASTGKSWWFVIEDDFVISSGDITGFQKIKKFPFQCYAPPRKDFIYILAHKSK
jgi:hypothetical protein